MNLAQKITSNIETVLLGKPDVVELAVSCFLAEGHLLIDDIPGVGKTTLALALANSVGCNFQRIQFTSDLLPSDLLGVSIYNTNDQEFNFKPGPIFHHVILADEINRASPKTQSALLESMQEGQVSLDNKTHDLPNPFFVIATQNPHEHHGTFPLPDSQLDRFMMRLQLGYPETEVEVSLLKGDSTTPPVNSLHPVVEGVEVRAEVKRIRDIKVDESLDRYIIELAKATRDSNLVDLGLSPRGTLSLRRAAQAFASMKDRDYVIPDDIKHVSVPVMAHRLRVKGSNLNGATAQVSEGIVKEILGEIPIPA